MGKRTKTGPRSAVADAALRTWGQELRRIRLAADVSQETVAGAVADDGSKSWTSQVESGQIDPPFTKILGFASAVGARLSVTSEDPWVSLEAAVGALPAQYVRLKQHISAMIRDERQTAVASRPKGRAAGASR